MRSYSEDELDEVSSINSSFSTALPLQDRILRRLPKRARFNSKATHDSDEENSPYKSTANLAGGKNSTSTNSDPEASLNELPSFLTSSSTASTTSVDTPSTPPPEAYSLYQPLFAPVDNLVRQAAAQTKLFGGAHLALALSEEDRGHSTEDEDEEDRHARPISSEMKSAHRVLPKVKSSLPAALTPPEDDHRFGDDGSQFEADDDFTPYRHHCQDHSERGESYI